MTTQAIITCVILVITMVLLISQKVPLVILGAAIPAALAATGVINAGSAYTEFGNTTIVFFMGLVVVGEAFFKTGLADFIGGKIIGLLGKTEKGLLLGTGLVAGGLSAFLNDTGSTACLMPIVSSMASKAGVKKSKLLMALAFFASLGGTITLVGTTPHIVANGILKDMGLREFGFFEYTKIGLPLLVCGMLYMCFCGTKLLPDKDIEVKGGDRTAEYDTKKMVLVALIFIGVLVAMATSIVPMHIAGVIGAILVVVTGCISLEEAIKAFPTSTIFIVGGIFPLSKALVSSGAAEYLVNAISPRAEQPASHRSAGRHHLPDAADHPVPDELLCHRSSAAHRHHAVPGRRHQPAGRCHVRVCVRLRRLCYPLRHCTQPAGLGSRRLLCEGLPQVRLPHADHLRCRHHRPVRSVLPVSTL